MVVVIDGVEERRPVAHQQIVVDTPWFNRVVLEPELMEGEEVVRLIDGSCHIIRTSRR